MVRQAKSFLILMDNYDRALEATAMGYNSAGSAAKEFGKWQDSIEGKTNNLKSALEQFSTKTLSSDFVGTVVDVTTSLVKFSTAIGGAVPLVLALGSAFATINILSKTALLTNLVSQFSKLASIVAVSATGITGLSLAGTLLVGSGIIAGIIAISAAINYVAGAADRAKEAVNTLSTELSDMQESSKTVDSLAKQYEELSKKTELSAEEQKNFADIQNQLKELLPEVNGYYDTQGNFIINENENLGSLNKTYAEYIALKREELALASKESASFTVKGYDTETNKVKALKEYLKLAQKKESGTLDTSDIDQVNYLQSMLGIDFSSAAIEKAISESKSTISASLVNMQSDIKNQVMNSPEWKKLGTDAQNGILKAFSEMSNDSLPLLSEAMVKGDVSAQDFINTLSNTQAFKDYIEYVKNAANKTSELGDEILALSDILSKFENSQSVVNSVKEAVNESGKLSLDNIQELIEAYPQLESVLYDYLAGLATTSEVMSEVDKAYLVDENNYKNAIAIKQKYNEEFYNSTANIGGKLVKAFNDSYGIDLSNCKNLAEAKIKVETETVKSIAKLWAKYYDTEKGTFTDEYYNTRPQEYDTKASSELNDALVSHKNLLDERISALNEIVYEGIALPTFDSSSSASKSVADELSEIEKLYEAFQKRIADKEFQISLLDFNGGEDTASKQIKLYEEMQSETHDLAEKARALGVAENDEYLQNLKSQWIDYSNKILDLSSETYDKANKKIADSTIQIELKQQLVGENSEEYLELEKQKYDNILAQETLLQQEIARLQAIGTKNAKDEAESLIDSYYDTVSERYDIIKNLQSIDIANLEKQKDAIESIHEYTMDMIKEELEAKKKSYQKEIDEINDVFDARKKAILGKEDTNDYNKGLSEKTSVVADLENQLAIIKNDETAVAKRKALESELTKAREDLADYQHDREIDLTIDALDERQKLETDAYQSKIDDLDETLSNEVKMNELANERIEKSGNKLYKQLINYAEEYGTITKDEIKNAWDNATSSINGYKTSQEGLLETLKLVTAELSKIDGASVQDYAKSSGLNTRTDNDKLTQMKLNSTSWTSASEDERKRLAEENQRLGKELGLIYESSTGIWWRDKAKKIRAFHEGGIVGGSQYATKSTEELVKVLKGEPILTQPMAARALDMITNNSTNQTLSPTIVFNIEGEASQSTIDLIKQNAKEVANIVASEFNKTRANTGFKKPVKAF